MPELPEVEVTRRSFGERIVGARVMGLRLGQPLRWPLGCEVESLVGQAVGETHRRGKYLWLTLERGGLLIHLGMSGSLSFSDALPPAGKHDHFELLTTQGTLRLTDPRRFGAVIFSPSRDEGLAAKLLASLGHEPFDDALTAAVMHGALRKRRVSIKQVLLSGDVVVGAGNIYACEALFKAGIDPRTRADRISLARCERLLAELRGTLAQALQLGGSTLRDFRDAHGVNGQFQAQAHVYDRESKPCSVCRTPIRRVVQAQRSTYFCPLCQRR